MSDEWRDSKYLLFSFYAVSDSGKTNIWAIESKSKGYHLGFVKWCGRWRQYCFYPEGKTVFNTNCLNDIQQFIDLENKRKRKAREIK